MRIGNLSGRLVVLLGDGVVDVETASAGRFSADPQAVYGHWKDFVSWAGELSPSTETAKYAATDLGSPAPRPAQVFAIGSNYAGHADEASVAHPEFPVVFTKFPSSITGPITEVSLSGETVDWEAELVVVMARDARHVSKDEAWSFVAGVTAGQDISDRTEQMKNQWPQWSLSKSLPGYSPMGPFLVTLDEFADPNDIPLGCSLNGVPMQSDTTARLLFDVPSLIADLSSKLPLIAGDVIFTGTPAGVGMTREPAVFLKPGDELVTFVDGVGDLRQTFRDPIS